ncbi:MAG: hypothetical protein AAFX56_15250 [Pseudomonadota bacterium]
MSNRALIAERMPAMLRHEGVWEGTYTTISKAGEITDRHRSRVICEFPDSGEIVYLQKNRFDWDNGDTFESEFGGILDGDRIVWDNDRFTGYGWVTRDDLVLLTLERNDKPGEHFNEVIVLSSDGRQRGRTWHWFRDGELYQRTLCDEHKRGA